MISLLDHLYNQSKTKDLVATMSLKSFVFFMDFFFKSPKFLPAKIPPLSPSPHFPSTSCDLVWLWDGLGAPRFFPQLMDLLHTHLSFPWWSCPTRLSFFVLSSEPCSLCWPFFFSVLTLNTALPVCYVRHYVLLCIKIVVVLIFHLCWNISYTLIFKEEKPQLSSSAVLDGSLWLMATAS